MRFDFENEQKLNAIVIAKRIRALRKERGLLQSDLADLMRRYGAKTIRVMISKWENGSHIPETQNLRILADIFDVSLDYISGLSDKREDDFSDYSIGRNIRRLRKAAGMRQEDLSAQIKKHGGNTPQSTIARWETGVQQPDTDSLRTLAEVFDVSVDAIIGYLKEPDETPEREEKDIDALLLELQDAIELWRADREKIRRLEASIAELKSVIEKM